MFRNRIVVHKTTENRNGRKLLEKDIEAYLVRECKRRGWMCEKFQSPQKSSVPDRLCGIEKSSHFPLGFIFFVELKAPGKKPTDKQKDDHEERRDKGHLVFVCDSYEEVDLAIEIALYIYCQSGYPVALPYCLLT
jgi:hypothetical protein